METPVIKYNQIKSAGACRYDGVALGEVMLRLDPFDVPVAAAKQFRVWQGGGETNVACGLSYTFGLRAAVLTALVDDHLGSNIRNQLRYAGVDTTHIIWFNTKNDGSRFSTDQKGSLMNGINFTRLCHSCSAGLPSQCLIKLQLRQQSQSGNSTKTLVRKKKRKNTASQPQLRR